MSSCYLQYSGSALPTRVPPKSPATTGGTDTFRVLYFWPLFCYQFLIPYLVLVLGPEKNKNVVGGGVSITVCVCRQCDAFSISIDTYHIVFWNEFLPSVLNLQQQFLPASDDDWKKKKKKALHGLLRLYF